MTRDKEDIMTGHLNPNLTPDPREEKLPMWVRTSLLALRNNVRDLEQVAAAVKGVHEGSNVRMLSLTGITDNIPLPKDSMIKFDNKWGGITVHHTKDGGLRIQGDNTLILHMNAGNSLTVELEG